MRHQLLERRQRKWCRLHISRSICPANHETRLLTRFLAQSCLNHDSLPYGHYYILYSTSDLSAGLDDHTFVALFAFFLLAISFLSFLFAVDTLRTNIHLAIIEWGLVIVFSFLAATFSQLAQANAALAEKCLIVSLAFRIGFLPG